MTAVILQARLDSSRLYGKAFLPIMGKPIIRHVMEALRRVKADAYILATSSDCAEEFDLVAKEAGFEIFVGPKDDVLARYCLAIREFGVETVIRATGDNPMVSWELANRIVEIAKNEGSDYAGFIGMPTGMGVECVNAKALFRAERETSKAFHREHVCPYLYENPDMFKILRPEVASEYMFPKGRVTIDTREDYENARRLFKSLYSGVPLSALSVVEYLRKQGDSI